MPMTEATESPQALEPPQATEPVEPVSNERVATRLLTLAVAVVMACLSLEGEQQLAKLALSGITVGTLLLTPDIGGAILAFGPKNWSGQTRARFATAYRVFLGVIAVSGMAAIVGAIVHEAEKQPLNGAAIAAYAITIVLLAAVIAIGALPLIVLRMLRGRNTAEVADERPNDKYRSIKELSRGARVKLDKAEAEAAPAGLGAALFLGGTALQFILLLTAHAHVTAPA